jgi:hypothetical protein
MNESRSAEGLSVAGMSNLSMTSDFVLRCTRAAEYSFHNGRLRQAIVDSRNMGEGDLPKALDQVNGKFLVRYELGLFGLPFSPLKKLLNI